MYRSYRSQRHGSTIVEFAIVAPIFVMLLFGIIEYGRMVMVQQVITNASREGARRAVLDGATTGEIETVVNDYMTSSGVKGATVTVSPDPPDSAGSGEPVSVTVSVPFTNVSWLPAPMFLGNTDLQARTVMRRESVQ